MEVKIDQDLGGALVACIYEELEQLIQDYEVCERTAGAIKSYEPRRANQVRCWLHLRWCSWGPLTILYYNYATGSENKKCF
jgi:hypothetical protein